MQVSQAPSEAVAVIRQLESNTDGRDVWNEVYEMNFWLQ